MLTRAVHRDLLLQYCYPAVDWLTTVFRRPNITSRGDADHRRLAASRQHPTVTTLSRIGRNFVAADSLSGEGHCCVQHSGGLEEERPRAGEAKAAKLESDHLHGREGAGQRAECALTRRCARQAEKSASTMSCSGADGIMSLLRIPKHARYLSSGPPTTNRTRRNTCTPAQLATPGTPIQTHRRDTFRLRS